MSSKRSTTTNVMMRALLAAALCFEMAPVLPAKADSPVILPGATVRPWEFGDHDNGSIIDIRKKTQPGYPGMGGTNYVIHTVSTDPSDKLGYHVKFDYDPKGGSVVPQPGDILVLTREVRIRANDVDPLLPTWGSSSDSHVHVVVEASDGRKFHVTLEKFQNKIVSNKFQDGLVQAYMATYRTRIGPTFGIPPALGLNLKSIIVFSDFDPKDPNHDRVFVDDYYAITISGVLSDGLTVVEDANPVLEFSSPTNQ